MHRGLSIGKNLGRAYLHYAPLLGQPLLPPALRHRLARVHLLPRSNDCLTDSWASPPPAIARDPTGYKGSVFNLVYVNNVASVKIWDSLGFTRAGLIPKAGLLKSATAGEPDEYVDAIVFHKSFF